MGRIGFLAVAVLGLLPAECWGQRTLLGRHPDDRVLPGFYAQQNNASNTVQALNLLTPAALNWTNSLIPPLMWDKTLSNTIAAADFTFTNASTVRLIGAAVLRIGTNSSLVMSNGAVLQDPTGARRINLKTTADSETAASHADTTNIVQAINNASGRWVSFTAADLTQINTNGYGLVIRDGVKTTNALVRSRFTLDGSQVVKLSSKATNYTLAVDDWGIVADATASNLVITLPAANTTNLVYWVMKKDASGNTVTLDGYSTETVNGSAGVVLSNRWQRVRVVSQDTEWYVLGD